MLNRFARLVPAAALLALSALLASPVGAITHIGFGLSSLTPCTSAAILASPTSPQTPGTEVTITGFATCSGTPEYRFLIQSPGGTWKVVREYSEFSHFEWDTTNLFTGTYGLKVEVRNLTSSVSYDRTASVTYRLAASPCNNLSIYAIPAGQSGPMEYGNTGTPVVVRADYYVPPGGNVVPFGCAHPLLRYWMKAPGGAWRIVQDYSSSTYYFWDNTQTPGTYYLEVDAREQLEGNSTPYDSVANLKFTLLGCAPVVGSVFYITPASPQAPGTTITITANSACHYSGPPIPNPTPTYRFWMRYPGQAWMIVQDYSTSNQYVWNTTSSSSTTGSAGPGVYAIEVDERMQGVTASYEMTDLTSYTLAVAACTAPTLSTSPQSPSGVGTGIVVAAYTSGCANPRYRFWIQSPNGVWTMVQDYSSSNTFDWSTTYTAGAYKIEVDVRDQLETSIAYDSVATIPYTLT